MLDFYPRFYAAISTSPAHAEFARRLYGADLGQHGFADLAQLTLVADASGLSTGQRAMDIGCGDGRISDHLAEATGAVVDGSDVNPAAITLARSRNAQLAAEFFEADINTQELPEGRYDAIISIDSLYFATDKDAVVTGWAWALRPGGRLVIIYSHSWEPWVPRHQFDAAASAPERTPAAVALAAAGLVPDLVVDLTRADCELARRRERLIRELADQFAAEGNAFIAENRLGDALGIQRACQAGLHARYLYRASR